MHLNEKLITRFSTALKNSDPRTRSDGDGGCETVPSAPS